MKDKKATSFAYIFQFAGVNNKLKTFEIKTSKTCLKVCPRFKII